MTVRCLGVCQILLAIVVLAGRASAQVRETEPVLGVTPTLYDLDLRLDYEAERLDGIARVTVTNTSGQTVSHVPFLLHRLMAGLIGPALFEEAPPLIAQLCRRRSNRLGHRPARDRTGDRASTHASAPHHRLLASWASEWSPPPR